jgi:hypothetical protein
MFIDRPHLDSTGVLVRNQFQVTLKVPRGNYLSAMEELSYNVYLTPMNQYLS